jgi:two-component system response regulator CpxR
VPATASGIILCVDDEEIPRTLRKLILEQQGYTVIAVTSAHEAIEKLAQARFDLVLTDQMMPGMSGTELTRHIKQSMPQMPVVIVSGVNEMPSDATYADGFVSKIAGPAELFRSIGEVLQQYRGADGQQTPPA